MREGSKTKENIVPEIICNADCDLVEVKALPRYILEVRFFDGTHGFVHMIDRIMSPKLGMHSALQNTELFNQVYIEHGVATWPGEIDLAPDVMHAEIKNKGIWVLR